MSQSPAAPPPRLFQKSNKVFVLYVDHQGHPGPLSSCFHATGTRRLSSSVERYPASTLTEIDSAYCPQCLTSHDAADAARLGFCPKPLCLRCPLCESALTLTVDGVDDTQLCFYKCGLCAWDSRGCGLTTPLAISTSGADADDSLDVARVGASISRVELTRAMDDLSAQWKSRREAADSEIQTHSKAIFAAWEQRTKHINSILECSKARTKDGPKGWSLESLEASMKAKKEALQADLTAVVNMSVERVDLDGDDTIVSADESIPDVAQSSVEMQLIASGQTNDAATLSKNDLLPLPMPFRARLSRRCRAELEEGRPGILLKPKLNPLEGDSSLRSGHGQWWKKDSSAIHVMPRIGVLQLLVMDNGNRVFLLKVTNPTLGPVRLRFASSSYDGEVEWGGGGGGGTASASKTMFFSDLLVDELFQIHQNVQLQPQITEKMKRTESVELLSAEDSFIELGGKSIEIPNAVKNWEPSPLSLSSADDDAPSATAMRLVASSASTAYFELVLAIQQEEPESTIIQPGYVPAVPLALQVEAGNGSWESSLIPKSTPEGEPDWVTFDLIIAWT